MKRPLWHINNEFRPFYRVMGPRPAEVEKKHTYNQRHLPARYQPPIWGANNNYQEYLEQELKGNLKNHEYEYFSGIDSDTATYSVCRWCRSGFNSMKDRKKHIVEGKKRPYPGESCTVKLRRAYQVLSSRGVCISCQQRTYKRHFGVPLCSTKCKNRFKFGYIPGYLEEFTRNEKVHTERYPTNAGCFSC